MSEEVKDCRNCKWGYADDHWEIPMCHYSGTCDDWEKWEPKERKHATN